MGPQRSNGFDVVWQVADRAYGGPIARVKSFLIDPGGGMAARDYLDEFEIGDAAGEILATTRIDRSSGKVIVDLYDSRIGLVDVADAVAAATAVTPHIVRGGLYRALTEDEIVRSKIPREQVICDRDGEVSRRADGRIWVINATVVKNY